MPRFAIRPPIALALLVLPAALACGAARRAVVGSGGADTDADTTAAAPTDSTAGGRWYGYEGGLDEAEAAARSIAGATQYWQEIEGRWRTDADSGTFTAHFHERRLRRLALTYGGGRATGGGAYTYDEQARLFHYGGELRRRTGTGRAARTTTTAYSLALDPAGTTSATRKTVGRRAQPLTAEEVQDVVARERAARAAAVRTFLAPQ